MRVEKLDWRAEGPLWLPYFDGRVPAGFPSPAEDYLEVPLDLNEYLVENKAATFLMRVDGDSMERAGIHDGDLLIVDRSARAISGSIVVVAVNGEYTVKRLRVSGEQVWLVPENPKYKPLSIAAGEELHVFGVVRHAIHSVR